jgi:hypothetical protein
MFIHIDVPSMRFPVVTDESPIGFHPCQLTMSNGKKSLVQCKNMIWCYVGYIYIMYTVYILGE